MKFLKNKLGIKILVHLIILLFLKFSYLSFSSDVLIIDEVTGIEKSISLRFGSWRVFLYHINQILAPLYGCLVIFFSKLSKEGLNYLPKEVFKKYEKVINELKLLPAAQIGYYIYEIYILLQFDMEMRTVEQMFINTFFICITLTMLFLYIIKNIFYND